MSSLRSWGFSQRRKEKKRKAQRELHFSALRLLSFFSLRLCVKPPFEETQR